MRLSPLRALLACALLSACAHAQNAASQQSSAPPSPPPAAAEATATAGGTESAPAAPEASPTPEPTPTPDANLISPKNGTIVRSYPQAAVGDRSPSGIADEGMSFESTAAGPFVFVYELPGTATISSFTAQLPAAQPSAPPATVAFAVSTTGATGDFRDAGTISAAQTQTPQAIHAGVAARWVRVTVNAPSVDGFGATGTFAPLPTGVSPAGIYVELDAEPQKNGAFNPVPSNQSPWYRRIVTFGNSMTATECADGRYGDSYPGTLSGRTWSFGHGSDAGDSAIVNDDASLIVGSQSGSPFYLLRSSAQPKDCEPITSGTGNTAVLVLDSDSPQGLYPVDDNRLPGYAYSRVDASMLDADSLAGKSMAIMNMLCDASAYVSKGQTDGLLQWVSAGHKLLVVDSDECEKSSYAFLPYAFTTSNPGAHGAAGSRLIVVESDALGTTDRNDAAHFFDPQLFINEGNNQLGDANIVTTQDSHWCGHLFGTNAKNDNGFMQMYAPYGSGVIIYDGFDHDDSGNPGYERVRNLEFALALPAGMPCTQSAALSFLIQPDQEATFSSGTAATLREPMETLANLGWSGHVDVKTGGDFPATVAPSGFDMSGGTQPLQVAVSVPASAKPGVYTVTVTGTGSDGKTAQATITITGSAPIKKAALRKHQRIRIYGIHFDYDSARIQPRSEPVIADIAALMRANPAWTFEVSGHTDSDGGAAYNLALSQRRAQSVVNDLVARYGIKRARLVAKGYGLTRPVASNATDAGKALNRRVELERLQ
ncbi:MAG TPA: OmpA family protein [Verrucomicrobiae bacterium]|nr:OmpA family protein [Verrucomicrobiae bacterium]